MTALFFFLIKLVGILASLFLIGVILFLIFMAFAVIIGIIKS